MTSAIAGSAGISIDGAAPAHDVPERVRERVPNEVTRRVSAARRASRTRWAGRLPESFPATPRPLRRAVQAAGGDASRSRQGADRPVQHDRGGQRSAYCLASLSCFESSPTRWDRQPPPNDARVTASCRYRRLVGPRHDGHKRSTTGRKRGAGTQRRLRRRPRISGRRRVSSARPASPTGGRAFTSRARR